VASSTRQWTGVAVSAEGRIFVNFPRRSEGTDLSVAEVKLSGEIVPYPNAEWNIYSPDLSPADHFVCVQSVYIDAQNSLWILDAASPGMKGVVEGGAKLVKVNLAQNRVERRFPFNADVAPRGSYLNDVRVDVKRQMAYITDSGLGALVVMDLRNGVAWRVLDTHPSTKAQDITVTVEGKAVPSRVHSDGIALDPKGDWLYFQALTGRTLFRVPTKVLRDPLIPEEKAGEAVQTVADVGPGDGLAMDADGTLYLTSIEKNAISRLAPKGKLDVLVAYPLLKWPDSIALTPEGLLFVTTSQIHLGPNPPEPYRLFCLKLR
jgi:hypothetical protein